MADCNVLAEDQPNDLDTEKIEYVASFSWNSGTLAASFFEMTTMELHVAHEAVDLKPDFPFLHNLFRLTSPIRVIASGPDVFIEKLIELMEIPPNLANIKKLRAACRNLSSSPIIVRSSDDKTLGENRRRVKDIMIPGMPRNCTDTDRAHYIGSILPINQNLIINSIGNLMHFLDLNWKQLFLTTSGTPIINDINIFFIESHVIVDKSTLDVLHIFSTMQHPSGFKKAAIYDNMAKLSLYSMLYPYLCSKIGSFELKQLVQQPIRDIRELNSRFGTVEWFLKSENESFARQFKKNVRKMNHVTIVFGKILLTGGKPSEWKSLLKSLLSSFNVCQMSAQQDTESILGTFLVDLAEILEKNSEIKDLLDVVDTIYDSEESEKTQRFYVRDGINDDLDAKRADLLSIQNQVYEMREILRPDILPDFIEFEIKFIVGFGYTIGIPAWKNNRGPKSIESDTLRYVFTVNNLFHYKTKQCDELDENYGRIYTEICDLETKIRDRLILSISENLGGVRLVVKLCAKLDCLQAMAQLSANRNLNRPQITTEKVLEIKEGRHLLVEMHNSFVPNDTSLGIDHKRLVNILTAPNSSGKSLYMRQVGLIVYMAHIGCFVPASSAKIRLMDAIYTQMASSESLTTGSSSFLLELNVMAQIMNNSSRNSLILADEFGKGTSTVEGRILLISCIESLVNRKEACPFTIITTHYPEVYENLRDKSLVVQMTFEVERDKKRDIITSKYKLKQDNYTQNYATCVPELREFMTELFSDNLK